jgi:1-acyl-sn-glycerol-3-phosphate acyltransferase
MTLYEFARVCLRPLTRTLFDARVSGLENVPPNGPLVVAANHRSYLDPPTLGAWFPRVVHFMAKRQLFNIALLGPLIARVHAFPVDRERADLPSIRQALRLLKKGEVVGIFPEGTRNLAGDVKARGGAVLLAAMARCPVVPVALQGTSRAIRDFRRSHVRVRIGRPMLFEGSHGKPTKGELEQWTQELALAIAALSEDTKA